MIRSQYPPVVVLVILLYGLTTVLFGQDQQALESQRKKIEAEIKYTNRLLEETRKNKQTTVFELRLIAKKIKQREELAATLRNELSTLETKISSTEDNIDELNKELVALKEEYARVAFFVYRHKSAYNKLIFLFSADDLNQAYQRLRYLDQIAEFIRKQAKTIREKEDVKQKDLEKLKQQKKQKNALLEARNIQLLKLEQEEAKKKEVRSTLTGKERQLRSALRKKEKEANKLRKKIEDIIAREMASKKSKNKSDPYALTPKEKLLSTSFSANKGKLPWPTEKGMISETFGIHRHPVLKNVKTKNNGLNIVTNKGSKVRTVFSGEVVSIVTITTTNKAVIVKHGEYFSVYANLDEVFVKKGDHLETMESVGRVHTNPKGKTELHFEIWKGKVLLNPSDWILKR